MIGIRNDFLLVIDPYENMEKIDKGTKRLFYNQLEITFYEV